MSRHWGSEERDSLRLARVIDHTKVLGPGKRAVVVVQGCELRCRGCTAPQTHAFDGGVAVPVADLARRLSADPSIAGVTFTGGEPFIQAAALVRLVDSLQKERPELSIMSYSGYRLEWLRTKGSPSQNELLDRLDLLVDGPYVERLHAPLRWRGSSNQRIHALTPRHQDELREEKDSSAGMEWSLDRELNMEWVGVPPVRGFADRLAQLVATRGAA